jgi:hypothetical protein
MPPRKPTPARVAPKPTPARPAAPAFTLGAVWAAAILALLTVVFFNALVFGGKTFVSPDASAPLGFVRVGEQSLYQDHVYPLWNPYVFMGMPSFASLAYNPLIYPPDWPVALLQRALPLPDMTWLLLYYFLAALFTFALAREWGARPDAALLAGCVYAFTPNLVAVGAHGHGSQLVNSAYVPLMLWLAARYLRRGGVEHLGFLALAGGFQLMRGHFQIAYYTWLALGGYLLVECVLGLRDRASFGRTLGRSAAVIGSLALALAMASFLFLPLREYNRYSIRGGGVGGGVGMEYATAWSMGLRELWGLIVPNAVGFGGATYWGTMPFTDYPHYIGVVTATLALFAFLSNGAPRMAALALALFAVLVGLGKHFPLYQALYDHLPYFKNFRIPVMILLLLELTAGLAAAWGWTRLLEVDPKRDGAVRRLMAIAVGALAVMGALGLFGAGVLHDGYVAAATASRPGYPREYAEYMFQATLADLGRVALLGLLALGVAWVARRKLVAPALASAGVLALFLVDVWPVSWRVMEPTIGPVPARGADADRDEAVRFFQSLPDSGLYRVVHFPLQVADPEGNRLGGFRIASLTGYHAAKPKVFQDAFDAHLFENPSYLGLLNVRYIMSDQPFSQVPGFLRKVHEGQVVIYENALALPRATLAYRARVMADPQAVIAALEEPTHDFAGETVLDREPGITLGPPAEGRVRVARYGLHQVDLDVETPSPAVVRLADLYYPDWRVEVDGKPATLLRADFLLRAVAVPAGRHQVRFRFVDDSLGRGIGISSLALILALGLVGVGLWRRRRPA